MQKKIKLLTLISIVANFFILIPNIMILIKLSGNLLSFNWSVLVFINIFFFIFSFLIGVVQLILYTRYNYGLFLWNGLINVVPFLSIISIFISIILLFNFTENDLIERMNKKIDILE